MLKQDSFVTWMHFFLVFFWLWSNTSCSAVKKDVNPIEGRFRLSFETLSLPEHENMGITGGTVLYDLNDWFSLGPASYGAMTGHRGGFITLGLASNAHKQLLEHFVVDSGVFLGAGGGDGGYTLVGGGLMLRAHVGLFTAPSKWGQLGFGASYVDFPNGRIQSVQPYVAYQYPFELYAVPDWAHRGLPSTIPPVSQEFSLVYRNYWVPKGVLTNNLQTQQEDFGLLGVQWYRYFQNRWFVTLESEGAMRGQSNGYMQILLGGGLKQRLTGSTFVKAMGEVGVAGGGGVYTGGGLLLDGGMGIQQYLTRCIYLSLNGDYVAAPNGKFRAKSVALQLGYGFDTPDASQGSVHLSKQDANDYQAQHLRLRATNQTYFQASSNWRSHHANEAVNLLGLQVDYFFQDYVYLTGQGLGAYQGNAGAYMTGLIGPGLVIPVSSSPVFINFEGLLGAAGGGGLRVGGGFVGQGNVGLGLHLTDALSLMGYYGYINAPKGTFSANILGISLAYQFSLFSR